MPFLRYSRDKRGYEHTYVLHTYQREGRSHPRLLYWFRTPPGVGVGRHPLDERAIKAIEEGNPNLSFDWSKMLKVRPEPPPDERRFRKKGAGKQAARGQKKSQRKPKSGPREAAAEGGEAKGQPVVEPPDPMDVADEPPTVPAGGRGEAVAAVGGDSHVEPPVDAEEDVAAGLDHLALDLDDEEEDEPPSTEPRQHPVVALMGDEMLARLRARYAELKLRIAEKQTDTDRLEAIQRQATALDPDRWKTVEDAVKGIEQFESEAEAIRSALGRRPPRRRKT